MITDLEHSACGFLGPQMAAIVGDAPTDPLKISDSNHSQPQSQFPKIKGDRRDGTVFQKLLQNKRQERLGCRVPRRRMCVSLVPSEAALWCPLADWMFSLPSPTLGSARFSAGSPPARRTLCVFCVLCDHACVVHLVPSVLCLFSFQRHPSIG